MEKRFELLCYAILKMHDDTGAKYLKGIKKNHHTVWIVKLEMGIYTKLYVVDWNFSMHYVLLAV